MIWLRLGLGIAAAFSYFCAGYNAAQRDPPYASAFVWAILGLINLWCAVLL